jgi:hypothetical protein
VSSSPFRNFLYKLAIGISVLGLLSSVAVVAFGVRLKYGGPLSLNVLKPYVAPYVRAYGVKDFNLDIEWKEKWDVMITLKNVALTGINAREIKVTVSPLHPLRIKHLFVNGADIHVQEVMNNQDSKENHMNILGFFSFPMRFDEVTVVLPFGKNRIGYTHLFITQEHGTLRIQKKENDKKKEIGCFKIRPHGQKVTFEGRIQDVSFPIKGPWKGLPFMILGGRIHGEIDSILSKEWSWSIGFALMQKKGTWFDLVSDHIKTHISRATLGGSIDHKKEGKIDGSVWVNQGQFHLHSTLSPAHKKISFTSRIHLEGTLAVQDLTGVWPEAVSPSARRWLISNFHKGTIYKSVCDLKGTASITDLDITDLKGSIGIKDLSLSFMPHMPHLHHVEALSWFDFDKFLIQVKSGQCSNHAVKGYLKITPLSGLPRLYLDVALNGPFARLFPLLLTFASIDGSPVKRIQGKDATRIKGEFPLLNDLKREQVNLDLESRVSQAAFEIKAFSKNLHVTQGKIIIRGEQQNFSIAGKSLVNTVPSEWKFQGDRLTFSSSPSLAQVKTLTDIDLSPYFSGPLQLQGVYTPKRTDVSLDLTKNTCSLPWIGWKKNMYVPLFLKATYSKGKLIFHTKGELQAKGECLFDDRGTPRKVDCSCTLSENFAQYRYENHNHRVFFEGPKIDLTHTPEGQIPSVSPNKISELPKTKSVCVPPADTLSLHFSCRELTMKTVTLQGCRVRLDAQENNKEKSLTDPLRWHINQGNIFAIIKPKNSKKRGYLSATFTPASHQETDIFLDVTDSGVLLSGLDITRKIQAGSLSLRAKQTRQGGYYGDLRVSNLETKAPFMLKLLSLVSPTLFVELFSSGITFHEVKGSFRYDDGKLFITKGMGKGINLGVFIEGEIDTKTSMAKLDGLVVPSYIFNTFFSYLPILGWILGGEKGVISSEFVLKGNLSKPQIEIKPFSLFKIGFIKNILEKTSQYKLKKEK